MNMKHKGANMKYFLVDVLVSDGMHEHRTHGIRKAKSLKEAQKNIDKWVRKNFTYGDDLTSEKLKGIKEITEAQKNFLEDNGIAFIL